MGIPEDGRYMVASGSEPDIVVLKGLGSEALTQIRVIRGRPFRDESDAGNWVDKAGGNPVPLIQWAISSFNTLMAAQRVVTADPYVTEISLEQAGRFAAGFGSGQQLFSGKEAELRQLELPPTRKQKRRQVLAPHEHVAAIAKGEGFTLLAEEFSLRARADLDAGRLRHAALQADLALEALLAEEESLGRKDHKGDIAALKNSQRELEGIADRSLTEGLEDSLAAKIDSCIETMERIFRRQRFGS